VPNKPAYLAKSLKQTAKALGFLVSDIGMPLAMSALQDASCPVLEQPRNADKHRFTIFQPRFDPPHGFAARDARSSTD
jgi:hypothetical protein